MSSTDDELQRTRTALADAQTALAAVRGERDAVQRERHAFLAGLAHDLRNPLAPLTHGIELLRLTDNDPGGRLRTRGIMERQVQHLTRIADDLTELARLCGDHATLQHAPFDLADALQGLEGSLAPTLQSHDMTLQLAPGLHGLPRLRGDAQRVAQAVGHLVNDIVRHAERGSTIRISGTVAGRMLALQVATVADIDADNAAEAPALENVDVAALGLGVALALQLATLHGGALHGRRTPGVRRTRFAMTLPVDEDAGAA